jgi:hypothetical protein
MTRKLPPYTPSFDCRQCWKHLADVGLELTRHPLPCPWSSGGQKSRLSSEFVCNNPSLGSIPTIALSWLLLVPSKDFFVVCHHHSPHNTILPHLCPEVWNEWRYVDHYWIQERIYVRENRDEGRGRSYYLETSLKSRVRESWREGRRLGRSVPHSQGQEWRTAFFWWWGWDEYGKWD